MLLQNDLVFLICIHMFSHIIHYLLTSCCPVCPCAVNGLSMLALSIAVLTWQCLHQSVSGAGRAAWLKGLLWSVARKAESSQFTCGKVSLGGNHLSHGSNKFMIKLYHACLIIINNEGQSLYKTLCWFNRFKRPRDCFITLAVPCDKRIPSNYTLRTERPSRAL